LHYLYLNQYKMNFRFIFFLGLILLFSNIINAQCVVRKVKKIKSDTCKNELSYRFADANEAADLLLSNRNYFENMNQNDLNYRLHKVNATLEELEEFIKDQVMDFTNKDKAAVDKAITLIKKNCKERGYTLPSIDRIVFVKITTLEENKAKAYTHGTQIYLGDDLLKMAYEEGDAEYFNHLIAHELFHCITRNNPDFRKDIYSIINFTVLDHDIDFPKETSDHIYSNPDVGHHNAYATFNINGEEKDCVVILAITKDFDEENDNILSNYTIGLVPLDNLYTIYSYEEASNFWDVFGENTNYAIDPEEAMADNFGFTLIFGLDGMEYKTPSIIERIDAYLKSYKH